jgi:hypothetical protein
MALIAGAFALTSCVPAAQVYDDPTDAYYFGGAGYSATAPRWYYGYPATYGYRGYYGAPGYYGPYAYPPPFPYYGREHVPVRPPHHRDPHRGRPVLPPSDDPPCAGKNAGKKKCRPAVVPAEPSRRIEQSEPVPPRRRRGERRADERPVEE